MINDKKVDRPIWVSILLMMGLAVFALVRFAMRSIAWVTVKASLLLEMAGTKHSANPGLLGDISAAKANVPVHRDFESTTIVATTHNNDAFIAADRIVSIRLEPPVAVLNLRIYYQQKLIKREMIVTEQRLRVLIQGRHHSLGECYFDPVKGLEEIKDETVKMAQELINSIGNLKVSKAKVKPAERSEKQIQSKQEKVTAKPQRSDPAPKPVETKAMVAPQAPEPPAQPRNPYVPRPMKGVTFEGKLVSAGSRTFSPEGRAPYETFEAMLKLDNGVDVPLRGAELERELQRYNVRVGERVAITPMGKVPVTLPSGDEGSKNVYRVARLDGAK